MTIAKGLDRYDIKNISERAEGERCVGNDVVDFPLRAPRVDDVVNLNAKLLNKIICGLSDVPGGFSLRPVEGDEKGTVTDPDLKIPVSMSDLAGIKERRSALKLGIDADELSVRPGDRIRSVFEDSNKMLCDALSTQARWERLKLIGAFTPLVDLSDFNEYYVDQGIQLGENLHDLLHRPDCAVQIPRNLARALRREEGFDLKKHSNRVRIPISELSRGEAGAVFEELKLVVDRYKGHFNGRAVPFFARFVRQDVEGRWTTDNDAPFVSMGFVDQVKNPMIGWNKTCLSVVDNLGQHIKQVELRNRQVNVEDLVEAGICTDHEFQKYGTYQSSREIEQSFLELTLFEPDMV